MCVKPHNRVSCSMRETGRPRSARINAGKTGQGRHLVCSWTGLLVMETNQITRGFGLFVSGKERMGPVDKWRGKSPILRYATR